MIDIREFPISQKTRNLVRFCVHPGYEVIDDSFIANYGFRDRGSHFSILKSTETAPGPDQCFSNFDRDARPVFAKLLGLELDFPGPSAGQKEHYQLYSSINYYRSHIEEHFCANGITPLPPIQGTCVMFYPETDRLAVSYTLVNNSSTDVSLRLRWKAVPETGIDRSFQTKENGFAVRVRQKVEVEYDSYAALSSSEPDLRFSVQDDAIVSDWVDRTVPAGGDTRFDFAIDFGFKPSTPQAIPANTGAQLRATVADAERAYASLPPLPEGFQGFEQLVLKAAGTLRTLRYMDIDPAGEPVWSIHAGKCGIACTYFWDSAFTLLGLGLLGDTDTAHGVSKLLLDGVKEDGTPPLYYILRQHRYEHQMPIYAWGVGHLLGLRPDDDFLADAYQPLSRYVNHWVRDCDSDQSGLVEYPDGGTCLDDSLRWQDRFPISFSPGEKWFEKDWGETHPGQFKSPDTNTHLYLECRTLAAMARRLGKESEAEVWNMRADRLGKLIHSELFNPKSGVYEDRSAKDGRFVGMVTAGSFLPLYAGITPPEIARDICRRYLLDPEHFYTTMPFASVDRAHPSFRSGGGLFVPPEHPGALVQQSYWKGRAWPHVSFWLVGALYRSGLEAEADEAARAILDAISRSEAIHECYDSLTGFGNGHPEFAWSSAAVLALAYGLYKHDPVGI